MKKIFLQLFIVLFYLLMIVCVVGAVGTMVDIKYKIDERYWLTYHKNELDLQRRELETKAYIYTFVAVLTFASATVMLLRRDKILRKV